MILKLNRFLKCKPDNASTTEKRNAPKKLENLISSVYFFISLVKLVVFK